MPESSESILTAAVDLPEHLNLAECFLERRLRQGQGERTALRTDAGTFTYAQVAERAGRVARALLNRGVRREERVLIALPDGVDFVATLFGVLKIGAVAVMLNPRLKPDEIAGQIDYTRARMLVVDSEVEGEFRAAAQRLGRWLESGLLVLGREDPADGLRAALARGGDRAPETVATHRDDAAIWLYSGGTTGRPKAVVQSHRSFAVTTELYGRRTLAYGPDDVTLSVPKLFFGYATGANLFFPFSVGASAVLFPQHPTPEVLFAKIAEHRPTILIHVPTLVQRMVDHPDAASQDLSCLRFATSAGEALPVELYHRWRERFGVELLDGLGTAEMWHVFVTNRPGDVKPGTLGRVVEGFQVEARDENGRPVAAGELGRMWVRGEARAQGYWRNMEKSRDAFRGPWFVAGDMIRIDAEGYVTYCGRGDDALKVGGRWLVPREVEDVLLRHPRVLECAVVGAADADGLMKPVAYVLSAPETVPEALAEELKQWALDRLQAYKHPRRVTVLPSFPRTHLGKVDRGALKRLAASEVVNSSSQSDR